MGKMWTQDLVPNQNTCTVPEDADQFANPWLIADMSRVDDRCIKSKGTGVVSPLLAADVDAAMMARTSRP
jgi:hypothetical protein